MWTNTPYKPSIALSPFIQLYWIGKVVSDKPLPVAFMPPTGFASILLSYGRQKLQLRNFGGLLVTAPNAIVMGQYFNYLEVNIPDTFEMIGILVRPSIFHRVFGFHMQILTHTIINAEDIFGIDVNNLIERLVCAETDEKRITEVECYLLTKFKTAKYQTHVVDEAVDLIRERKGNIKMKEITDYFKCSSRYIEKKFKSSTGVSPKYMARVIQFNNALSILKYEPKIKWTDLAIRSGYYDQAHLINAFTEFAALTPNRYTSTTDGVTEFYLE